MTSRLNVENARGWHNLAWALAISEESVLELTPVHRIDSRSWLSNYLGYVR